MSHDPKCRMTDQSQEPTEQPSFAGHEKQRALHPDRFKSRDPRHSIEDQPFTNGAKTGGVLGFGGR